MNKKQILILSGLVVLATASYLFFVKKRNERYNKIEDESFTIYVEK